MSQIPDNPTTIRDIIFLNEIMKSYETKILEDLKNVSTYNIKQYIENELRNIRRDISEFTNITICTSFEYGINNYKINMLWKKWAVETCMNR